MISEILLFAMVCPWLVFAIIEVIKKGSPVPFMVLLAGLWGVGAALNLFFRPWGTIAIAVLQVALLCRYFVIRARERRNQGSEMDT